MHEVIPPRAGGLPVLQADGRLPDSCILFQVCHRSLSESKRRTSTAGNAGDLLLRSYICLSTISVAEFFKQICSILGVSDRGGKTNMFKAIQEQIYYLYHEKRQPLFLAVDEAQYLSQGIMNDIKMLMNHGYDSVNCFTLILCGEPQMNHNLKRPVNEALRQRITVHYNYQGLSEEESVNYVIHKLQCAGSSKAIIEEAALLAIAGQTHGNPRLIDNLMTDAITIGAQQKKKCIDSEIILAAVNNQNLG